MPFHNIFSKKPEKKTKVESRKIIVDIHEKNSLILANLIELGAETEIKSLEIGDYLVGDTIIERKTMQDFISSMLNKRLLEQLKNMTQYENRLLIIEGKNGGKTSINPNAIKGMVLSISLNFKIPIINTENDEETANYLFLLAKQQAKQKNEVSLHSRIPQTKQEQKRYIIESFQGIGPATADKLLKKFGTIKNIINSSAEELEKEIGKKAEIFKILEEDY
jgi:Fanconi anemia group M protein